MSVDLPERLRTYATAGYKPAYQPPICHEAADEIDRLRAQLAAKAISKITWRETVERLRTVLDELEKQP